MTTANRHVKRAAELHRLAKADKARAQERRADRDDEIVAALADGVTPAVIAAEVKVGVTTVYNVQKVASQVRRKSGGGA